MHILTQWFGMGSKVSQWMPVLHSMDYIYSGRWGPRWWHGLTKAFIDRKCLYYKSKRLNCFLFRQLLFYIHKLFWTINECRVGESSVWSTTSFSCVLPRDLPFAWLMQSLCEQTIWHCLCPTLPLLPWGSCSIICKRSCTVVGNLMLIYSGPLLLLTVVH